MSKRVYEIAREQSLGTKEVIERLRSAGVEVKNHFAVIEEPVYQRIFGNEDGQPDTPAKVVATATGGAAQNGQAEASASTAQAPAETAGARELVTAARNGKSARKRRRIMTDVSATNRDLRQRATETAQKEPVQAPVEAKQEEVTVAKVEPGATVEDLADANVYLAALRATLPLPAILAVVVTVFLYVLLGETGIPGKIQVNEVYAGAFGAFTVTLGLGATIFIWLVVSYYCKPYTAADSANRLNYNLLRENLDLLRSRIAHSCPDSSGSEEQITNTLDREIRNRACGIASRECNEIEKGLKSRGMPWVTGRGYIELWHRVHRAEEALIMVEPQANALAGAMHDESRLMDSHIRNKDLWLKRLRCAVGLLDDSETGEYLNYLAEPEKCSLPKQKRATPENRLKALTILSEVRYEINNFRDSVWEGIINARNRLIHSSAILGFVAYSLLGLAIFMNVPYYTIVWVVVYFAVGALTGLFARSQTEWTADTAVDDFGLSTSRLLQVHWLSGLAAVGGVLVTSLADALVANSGSSSELTAIFGSKPFLLMVAAVFGLAPDLLIQRLAQQADKYKEDLQSTESSQSTKSSQSTQPGQPSM